ncbi:hypothetical protein FDG48_18820 [Clostridium sporogenes]|nr:hypothetical protein [Clostridium sporogenes]
MSLLISILTIPLIYISISEIKDKEKFYKLKLILLWFLCHIYITINKFFILPIGIFISFYIVMRARKNLKSKLISFLIGIFSFLLSMLCYQIKS